MFCKPYCEYTRPGQQLEAAQRQHADLCKVNNLLNTKVVTLHTTLLGVGGIAIERTLNQSKQLGLDHQHANKLARKLHAHSVIYADKLVTTRHAVENIDTYHSQALEPGVSVTLLIPISIFMVEGTLWAPVSLTDVGRASSERKRKTMWALPGRGHIGAHSYDLPTTEFRLREAQQAEKEDRSSDEEESKMIAETFSERLEFQFPLPM
eukprot:1151962-Pelagomonas_calceolata.AAC.1